MHTDNSHNNSFQCDTASPPIAQAFCCEKIVSRTKIVTLICAAVMLSTTVRAQTEDVAPPVLTDVTVTPASVDTLLSSQAVQVTRSATDDLSGVAYQGAGCTGIVSGLVFVSPSGVQTVKVNNCAFTITSGTELDGEFSASAIFPQYAETGMWNLISTVLEDQAGNTVSYSASGLASLGISAQVEVTSPGDTTAPTLTAVAVSPAQVDTSLSSQAVQVTRSATDDLSGVAYSGNGCTGIVSGLVFVSPSGSQTVKVNNCNFSLSAGSAVAGDFTANAIFPQFAEVGVWHLASTIIEDKAHNTRSLGGSQLATLGISASVEVISPGDTTPPELIEVSVSPQFIDVSHSQQTVAVTVSTSDDISGYAYSGHGCSGIVSGLVFASPTGIQSVKINNCSFNLVSGSDLAGDFSGTAEFPQFAESGIWPMTSIFLEDQAGNLVNLGPSQLADLGIDAYVEVAPLSAHLTCAGFQPPMQNHPVKAKKNRVFPLKMELLGSDDIAMGAADISAAPVVQVIFDPTVANIDVTDEAFPVGNGTEGNQFEFTEDGIWQFNMKSTGFSAPGTYLVTAVSGDETDYIIDPACVTSFVID